MLDKLRRAGMLRGFTGPTGALVQAEDTLAAIDLTLEGCVARPPQHLYRASWPWSPNMGDEPPCGVCGALEDDPVHLRPTRGPAG